MSFDAHAVVQSVREGFNTGISKTVAWRRSQIAAIKRMIKENSADFEAALRADLGVNDFFAQGVELEGILNECDAALSNLRSWMEPTRVSTPLLNLPALAYIRPEPFGVALIIGAGNYPLSLVLQPMIAAFSAGNAVVVKPSEISVACEKILATLIPRYLDLSCCAVVTGGVPETTAILKEKFDVIMYTGNGFVGRIVMRAAAEHLTPVILELGGKCPAMVCPDANVSNAAKRIVWGKWTLNNGQTCLSPDYVITTPDMRDQLVDTMCKTLKEFYGPDPQASPDVSRMINDRYLKRVAGLLDDDTIKIVAGGEIDEKERYIAPTIVLATPESKCMREEIFGPILAVVTVPSVTQMIDFVNSRDKPLGLYAFTSSSKTQEHILDSTSSGGAVINDVVMHAANLQLPFGGVGGSGIGSYHGKHGFDSFSHKKAVMYKYGADPSLRFAPYTPWKLKALRFARSLKLPVDARLLLLGFLVLVVALFLRVTGRSLW